MTDPKIRKIPYPYHAMLAVCSDLDETPTKREYFEIARFLNTEEETAMGPGVGLEIGNTLYFDMPDNQFAYWNTDDEGRESARRLIRSGHIDCFHSYGDLAVDRGYVERALNELESHDCCIRVWVDHSKAATNFDPGIMFGKGDLEGHEAFHSDLTYRHGVRYVWRGRVTSVIGQDCAKGYGGLWSIKHALPAAKTILKDFVKSLLALKKHPKYALHKGNRLIYPASLRSGESVTEFMRCNPHWGGVSAGETAQGIPEVLTDRVLSTLTRKRAKSIIYTHLGKIADRAEIFSEATRNGFRRLKGYADRQEILVATTYRLLQYTKMTEQIRVEETGDGGLVLINLVTGGAEYDLSGLTVYTDAPESIRLTIDNEPVKNFEINSPDETGRASISISWNKLTFPDLD
ncbi:MAG: hypothetical protein JMN27_08800 [gamma proteobacterium endosymbiont of Lamellibrachia anaximandri]|nr:hypothetical protein [gamma proteobacterium endosymbiont of Lamellibrachia anaximandri]MBL3533916.1 hypothetical protein [gamma proteobacterium endosymbiont of Lamellibrachia anaximandri]